MTAPTTYTLTRWCPRCCRSIQVTVTMQIARPADRYWADRWTDAARRDAEARYQVQHAETCGRKAP